MLSQSYLASDSTKECSVFCQGSDADEVGGVLHLIRLVDVQPAHQQALLVLPVAVSDCLGQHLAGQGRVKTVKAKPGCYCSCSCQRLGSHPGHSRGARWDTSLPAMHCFLLCSSGTCYSQSFLPLFLQIGWITCHRPGSESATVQLHRGPRRLASDKTL